MRDENRHTETLNKSNYEIRSSIPSKLINGMKYDEWNEIKCPRCEAVRQNIKHGETAQCGSCNLYMTVYGNALIISNENVEGGKNE